MEGKMGTVVNVHEAKTHLSRLLERVRQGEEIVIAKSGEPVARLVGIRDQPERRTPGSAKGMLWVSEDFDDPLPEEILGRFER